MVTPLAAVLTLASVLTGCVDEPPVDTTGSEPSSTDTADTTTAGQSGTGMVDPTTGAVETTAVDTDDTASDTTAGGGFIYGSPDAGDAPECDVFLQDCPEGQKCMPWANDGGNSWNDTRCSPVADSPGAPGDPCTVEGSGVSGVDDCELGAMCWNVDPDTDTGTCVAMCTGTPAMPECDDPQTACSISNGGVLALCLPTCDPVTQDCEDGQTCVPVNDVFVCIPGGAGKGTYGTPCDNIAACDPGLVCVAAEAVPDCMSNGCCTELCSLSDPAGNDQCTGAPEGQQCQPWYDEPPPGFEDVGFCTLPT